eukprot:g27849.t1
MSSCEKGGRWQEALLLWSQMPSGMANVRTFNAAISACATSAQPDVSFLLLQQMSAMVLTPDVISYSAAVHACEKGWRWKDALHLLNIMVSRSTAPNLITLNSAIAACDKAGVLEGIPILSQTPFLGKAAWR